VKLPTEWGDRVERGRDINPVSHTYSRRGDDYGFFFLRPPIKIGRDTLRVMVSSGDEHMLWEHVSVSLPNRCPTWEEMAWVKSLFWREDECVLQYHPPKAEYVSFHPFCLHLWRPIDAEFPRPPMIAVGPSTGQAVPR
jgi:hypothetical protein